ncbi:MAG: adenosyl-hopene transferase HpnH [Candidatus Magnetoovum sp. WYHC-5]|nr:adenosyl-hopene transferase HpnH [Candidatus Magnetoovum sp. WYHC-5]
MRFPISLYTSLTGHFIKNAIKKNKKFPLVLMLEPTHRCNLACAGCDRIRLYNNNNQETADLSLDDCINAAIDCEAPVVTITGGEPVLYQHLVPLVTKLIELKKHIYLCTNGILTDSFIQRFTPNERLTLNFHLDGLEPTHDKIAGKIGTFNKAVENIKGAKQKGFRVTTNTSVYKNTSNREIEELFLLLKGLNVDGILVSPAFSYETVADDIFLTRKEVHAKFLELDSMLRNFPLISSPIYMDFLKGNIQMHCTPWGNPTRNPFGWKSPCYLITNSYYNSFAELIENTDWNRYENGLDERCTNCMVHSGYEASVMRTVYSNPKALFKLIGWNLT